MSAQANLHHETLPRRRWPLARLVSLLLVVLTVTVVIGFFWFGGLFAPEEGPPPPELLKELEAYDKSLSITRDIVIKGRDEKGNPYLITASRTERSEKRKHVTQLFDVMGKLESESRKTIYFRAERANVNHKSDDIVLAGKVIILKQGGWRLRAPEVHVNSNTRDMTSDQPVVVRMQDALIHARGIHVEKRGEVVRFKGPVHAQFDRPAAAGAEPSGKQDKGFSRLNARPPDRRGEGRQ